MWWSLLPVIEFPNTELLRSTEVVLQSASGNKIVVAGEIDIMFRLANQYIRHTFIVAENITQNIIIGRDCLKKHEMKIDFGKCELQLRNCTVPIESESYLNSLVQVASQKILKPQTATVVWGKFQGQKFRPEKAVQCDGNKHGISRTRTRPDGY